MAGPAQATAEHATQQQHDPNPPTTGTPTGGTASGAQPATVNPATATAYDKDAFLKCVKDRNAALAVRMASFNPTQAMADLASGPAGSTLNDFFTVVRNGKPYSAITRAQLSTIYHGIDFPNQQRLMAAQFNVTIQASGATAFTQAELLTIYDQARQLPPNQVEGNPAFQNLLRGNGVAEGTHGGSTITMGAQGNATRYAQVFRHEVGHAVDDRLGGQSNDLRLNQAGWHSYNTVDEWITALGGYGTIPASLQATAKNAAQAYMGPGNTFNSPTATFEETLLAQVRAAHPGVAQAPDGSDAVSKDLKSFRDLYATNMLLKTLIASQGNTNYFRFAGWPAASGKVFFINHYYAKGYSLSTATHTNLKSWGNVAAAFSDKEWFAEIYADWYQAGVGGAHFAFPDYVTNFFTNVVDKMGAGATPPPATAGSGAAAGGTAQRGGGGSWLGSSAPPQQAQAPAPAAASPAAGQQAPEGPQRDFPGFSGDGGGGHPKVPR